MLPDAFWNTKGGKKMVQDIQAKLKEIEDIYGISEYLNGFFLSYDIPRATLVRLGLNESIPADKEIIIGN